MGEAPGELGSALVKFGFADTVASSIGAGAGHVCSDFRLRPRGWSNTSLFNKDLNAYRLGRMVRRIYEICSACRWRATSLQDYQSSRRALANWRSKSNDTSDSAQEPSQRDLGASAAIISASAKTGSGSVLLQSMRKSSRSASAN
ncbi:DUF3422 family protein [Rhizobium grahamii]|uniref:DUF3422 family protein n=1 Tax=Rhizobium grahamii TaxID=1120045 RepID=UPI0024680AE3|nr:DUF3422 family protein [Rhizobium grahamii]